MTSSQVCGTDRPWFCRQCGAPNWAGGHGTCSDCGYSFTYRKPGPRGEIRWPSPPIQDEDRLHEIIAARRGSA